MTVALVASVVGALGVAAAFVWARRRLLIATVRGRSMEPTLLDGERVWVRRRPVSQLRTGHVVLIEPPPPRQTLGAWSEGSLVVEAGHWPAGVKLPGSRLLVKRIASVGGDPTPDVLTHATVSLGETVPAGHLVVLGDNPDHSYDSRTFGYLPASAVVGVVSPHRYGAVSFR